MPKIKYQAITFREQDKLDAIKQANTLIASYRAQGYTLTLRQVYYQFVAKDLFPDSRKWTWTGAKWVRDPNGTKNAEPNYKWLGDVVGDARMAGLMDWEAIEDRTREVDAVSHWETPASILRACHNSFRVDKWTTQDTRLEVWVEKDAVEGIAKRAAHGCDVAVFSCRGYGSLSSLWESANRLRGYVEDSKKVVILHLGDHDPSGIDMTRDLRDRLNHFVWTDLIRDTADILGEDLSDGKPNGAVVDEVAGRYDLELDDVWDKKIITVRRIALTMEQVHQYNPPPNPAKATDARYKAYQEQFGDESWELDALEPAVLSRLVREAVVAVRDEEAWAEKEAEQARSREELQAVSDGWDAAVEAVRG